METPPALPAAKPPLGAQFYILLLTPLAFLVLSVCCMSSADWAGPVFTVTAIVTLGCSIVLARQLSRRLSKTGAGTAGMSILLFFAIQAFYAVCFFVGCTSTLILVG